MNAPLWITGLAGAFWRTAGPAGPSPRDLRGPALVVKLVPIDVAGLRLARVVDWLNNAGFPLDLDEPDRPLRAALAVNAEAAFVFLEQHDSEDERRFSLAHELAHYLRDFWLPRQRAQRHIGESVLEVFNRGRKALPGEVLRAILADVPLDTHTHLLRRDPDGKPVGREALAERDADRLAYELLAPADLVLAEGPGTTFTLARRLQHEFGLPRPHAVAYARVLSTPNPAFERWLARLLAEKKD